jgi:general secretion pathway protein E
MSAVAEGVGADLRLPFTFARRHGVLVRGIVAGVADCVYRAPASPVALAEARRFLRVAVKLTRVDGEMFDELLRKTYEGGGESMQIGFEDTTDLAHLAQELPEQADLLESNDDAPIIRLINAVLTQAIRENASDIHIEPFENRLVVRFRVDGILREVLQSKRGVAPLVVSRIKVMSKLDIAEKRLPQDGRISLRIAGRAVDVRVSTIPSGHGERVVLRLLDKQAGRLDLDSLGMGQNTQQLIDELIHKPHGILLVTGPTGSGKTTTLYAALECLNDNTRNIMTVEDPIEYYIDGIGQTQVNTKVEMTFARGLRAILRQDPDVIMVGEIRDGETAGLAVQAALTGHVVLSTLHTNNAAGVIPRLIDLKVEPFLLPVSLNLVIAQRLIGVLCPDCKAPETAAPEVQKVIAIALEDLSSDIKAEFTAPYQIYRTAGCATCKGRGILGRTGIYEAFLVTKEMEEIVSTGVTTQKITDQAKKQGMITLRQDGIVKALKGIVSIEEIIRETEEA